jgi:hypothetical protein
MGFVFQGRCCNLLAGLTHERDRCRLPKNRKPYPSVVSDEKWSFVAPYLACSRCRSSVLAFIKRTWQQPGRTRANSGTISTERYGLGKPVCGCRRTPTDVALPDSESLSPGSNPGPAASRITCNIAGSTKAAGAACCPRPRKKNGDQVGDGVEPPVRMRDPPTIPRSG